MIKPLTTLRFVFALMVFVSHLSFLNHSKSDLLNFLYKNVFYEGFIGVNFFFILSGFVLAFKYQHIFIERRINKIRFYTARFARIVPLHILTFLLSIPLVYHEILANKLLSGIKAILNITLIQSYFPYEGIYFSYNSPSWSISDEMFFYLVFPFLIYLIPKIKKYKISLLLVIILSVPVLVLLVPESYYHSIFYINPFLRVVDFIGGISLYNIYIFLKHKKLKVNYTLLELTSVILLVMFLVFHNDIPEVARYSYYYWIPIGFLILVFSFQRGIISKILSNRVLMHLGEISFGFYLLHLLVVQYIYNLNSTILHIKNDMYIISIIFVISLVLSHYSFILFESPLNKKIKAMTERYMDLE